MSVSILERIRATPRQTDRTEPSFEYIPREAPYLLSIVAIRIPFIFRRARYRFSKLSISLLHQAPTMKSLIFSALLVGIVCAQSLAGLPTCACKSYRILGSSCYAMPLSYPSSKFPATNVYLSTDSCVANSIPASCNLAPKCICSASSFIAGVTCCVAKVCSVADHEGTSLSHHSTVTTLQS